MNLKLHYYWFPILITVFLLLFSLLGYGGRFFWFCDLFVHFKVQYFLISILCGIILFVFAKFAKKTDNENRDNNLESESEKKTTHGFALTRKTLFIYTAFSFAVALINLFEIAPLYIPCFTESSAQNKLRLMHLNVYTANTRYNDVQQYIIEQDPDILLLEEVSEKWIKNLPEIIEKYPYKTSYPQSDNFGIAMFAKIKPVESKILLYGKYGLPYIKAVFKINGKAITFFGIHTIPPIGRTRWEARNRMLNDVAKWANGLNGSPVIVLGDLNVTPWSYHFEKLLNSSNLRNSQYGFGVQPSWPTSLFPLLIPLDHCLISEEITVSNRFIGKDIGSDHYPLIVEIEIP